MPEVVHTFNFSPNGEPCTCPLCTKYPPVKRVVIPLCDPETGKKNGKFLTTTEEVWKKIITEEELKK